MEWLAGGRMPSWASPYSYQATEALLAQFPTQWPTIRDYGFAHPEIVGYMNAYAPEDAKIAYSLVPTLGVIRWLYNGGNSYFYLADYTMTNNSTAYAKYKFRRKIDNMYKNRVFGYRLTDSGNGFGYFTYNNKALVNYGTEKQTGINGPDLGVISTAELRKNEFYMDGELAYTAAAATFSVTNRFCFFALGNANTQYIGDLDASEFIVDGHRFVPFQRNGAMELLELETGSLATKVGTFTEVLETISETPAS